MDDKTLLINAREIAIMLLKNAGHSYGIDFMILNDTMIELNKRLREMGVDISKLSQ